MGIVGQIGIIFTISLIGELLNRLLPLPVPASVYGLVIMLLALCAGVIKLRQVERIGDYLLDILTFLLVPVSVGIISSWSELRSIIVPFLIICLVGTVAVMVVTGLVVQKLIGGRKVLKDERDAV